jgi:glycosyltransferase involved in cell wall biosynthesis
LDFDILIVTRNRREALEVSLPLMLSQNRVPKRVIVVDASDDHGSVRSAVERAARASSKVELCIINSDAGTSHQRNVGLRYVGSEVVFMPDDDALWYPGFAEAVMRIYERDERCLLGGVGAEESSVAPSHARLNLGAPISAGMRSRVPILETVFSCIENRYIPDPLMLAALAFYRNREKSRWLHEEDAVLSGAMTGFRMSFRSKAIQTVGFDEVLGRYALFEDFDAGLGVLKDYSIARSGKAQVFHYRLPENRTDGREYGVMQILNRVYILGKHSPQGSEAWKALARSSYYVVLRFIPKARGIHGRQCLLGAWKATTKMRALFGVPKERLADQYLKIRAACLA